jgi:hypothetical protein
MRFEDETVRETLCMTPETSATALMILRFSGVDESTRRRAVADVLNSGAVPQPPHFPASTACERWGRTIAEYVLAGLKLDSTGWLVLNR